ncbi:MAG TPA: hypothetical protein ENI87_03700 [bacterium]|nr:hypothetical protein [bacterium]
MVKASVPVCIALLSAACAAPPKHTPEHYKLRSPTEWERESEGTFLGSLAGLDVRIELLSGRAPVLMTVENVGEQAAKVRVGPFTGVREVPIGEVLLRQIDAGPEGGPPMRPYVAMQDLGLQAGWRATFFLDRPLGRPPKLGEYFDLSLEVQDAAGKRHRRVLPISWERREYRKARE